MDTSGVNNVDNPPLSSAEPFHFTASTETHSTTPAANNDTSANIHVTSTEGGLASKADDSPSPKDSTTLGDTPPSKPRSESHYTVKPMPASNTDYSPDGTAIIDKIDDDDDDDFERDETSQLISTEQDSQPQTGQHLRSRHMVAPGHSYNSTEDTQPLLDEGEGGDEDTAQSKTTSSSWFSYFSVRSAISYLINIGSSIGSSLLYYISGIFRPRVEPEPANNHNH